MDIQLENTSNYSGKSRQCSSTQITMQVDSKQSPAQVTGTQDLKLQLLRGQAGPPDQTGPRKKGLFISRSRTEEKLGLPWGSHPWTPP